MKAGTTRNAWSIFVLKANPTRTAERRRNRVLPFSTAFQIAQAAARQRNVRNASGLLNRNMSTATGVSANATAAMWAAMSPAQRRTSRCRIRTDATPASASGSSMLHELKPKRRAESDCTHSAIGGLSTVMKLPASSAPKNIAFQLTEPAFTAAA
jgi:hypothetical protein